MALPNRPTAVNDGGGGQGTPVKVMAGGGNVKQQTPTQATKSTVVEQGRTGGPAARTGANPVPVNQYNTSTNTTTYPDGSTATGTPAEQKVSNTAGIGDLKDPTAPGVDPFVHAQLGDTKRPVAGGQPLLNPGGTDADLRAHPTGDPNVDPSQRYPGGGNGSTPAIPAGPTDAELLEQALRDANLGMEYNPYPLPDLPEANPERLDHVDTTDLRGMLQQIIDAQKQQSQNQIDYGVQQGVNELNRAMEDAAAQYQTQRDQATADEMRALDNQALYAEARGDRGGIGEAQYASIQAAAAQNRRAVNDAQVKLGTDTARQISDLRSQGEFEKADQLLTITQNYLSKLMGLEQWALEANMGVDEFNSQLQQWVDEYNLNAQKYLADLDLSAAQLTGAFANGNKTLAAQNQLRESLANSGSALLSAGVMPSKEQLEAMGMTAAQAKAYIARMAVV